MELDWRDVSVTVQLQDGSVKTVLAPCSGRVKVGRMVAVMGPSSSGKTTLLRALQQDIAHDGIVHYDGQTFSPSLKQFIGVCDQDDVLIQEMDVWSYLHFYAQLRYGINTARAKTKVHEVLTLMRLDKVWDELVAHISGGERKRLCIARELIGEPRILLCDEPTSRMDATMAYGVTSILRKLCDSGQTSVLVSLHQPSSKIFEQFDDVMLLRQNEMVYFGPCSQAEQVLSSFGPSRKACYSVPEFLMDCLVKDEADPDGISPAMSLQLAARSKRLSKSLPLLGTPPLRAEALRYQAPAYRQIYLLFRRHNSLVYAEHLSVGNFIQHSLEMLIAACAWCQLDFREDDVRARFAISNWIIGHWVTHGTQMNQFVWRLSRPHLDKELGAGMYSLSSYFIARVVLTRIVQSIWPTYWTLGMFLITRTDTSWKVFCWVCVLTWLVDALYQAMVLALTSQTPSQHGSHRAKAWRGPQQLSMMFMSFSILWTGFYADLTKLPGLLKGIQFINPMWYAVSTMSYLLFPDDKEFPCDWEKGSHYLCFPNSEGRLVLNGTDARVRHRVVGQMPLPLCVAFLCSALVGMWALAFAGVLRATRHARFGVHRLTVSPHGATNPLKAKVKTGDSGESCRGSLRQSRSRLL